MDEEKAKKFLSAEDAGALRSIAATHEWATERGTGLNSNAPEVDAVDRHRHRGELLGIVDRLLATAAGYAAQVETLVKGTNAYAAFGHLKPWFGGPYAALALKPEAYDRVFGLHEGVAWSYGGLSQRASHLQAEVCRLAKLADKPLAILDDAQGYYTVTDPFDGNANITVKQLARRNVLQKAMLDERDQLVDDLRRGSDNAVNTINRKDAKLIEQQQRIDELERENEALKVKLRAAQEDYGDVMVALMELTEENNLLDARLSKIADVADGYEDEAYEDEAYEDEAYERDTTEDFWSRVFGIDMAKGPDTFSVTRYVYDPITGSIKRKD